MRKGVVLVVLVAVRGEGCRRGSKGTIAVSSLSFVLSVFTVSAPGHRLVAAWRKWITGHLEMALQGGRTDPRNRARVQPQPVSSTLSPHSWWVQPCTEAEMVRLAIRGDSGSDIVLEA